MLSSLVNASAVGYAAEVEAPAATGPKTIVFFDHTATLGGGEIALLNLVKALDRSRYLPVVVLASEGELKKRLVAAGIETHVLPLAPSVVHARKDTIGFGSLTKVRDLARVLAYSFALSKYLRERSASLLHTNSLKADVIGGIAGRLAGVPVLWHVRDRISPDYLPRNAVRAFRLLCRFLPTYVVANSNATLQTLPFSAKSAAVPSGLAESELNLVPDFRGNTTRRRSDTRRVVHDGLGPVNGKSSDNAPAGSPLIGLVGRLTEWKGQHIFLRAAKIVLEKFPAARFQIIGGALFNEQEYEKKLIAMTKNLGLEDFVEFTGFRTDVPDLIAKLDILVHASIIGEPFGQVVIEGMAAAKPVIATRGGGVPEIVVDGVTGLLVPMADAEAMAAAIKDLLTRPAAAREMGRLGRQRVLDHFTIQQTAAKMQQVYETILLERTPAPAYW